MKAAVFPQHTAHTIVAAEKKEKCTTWLSSQSNKMEKGNRRRKSGMENSFPREKVFLYFCCEAQNADFFSDEVGWRSSVDMLGALGDR